jgi:hypothetical protein
MDSLFISERILKETLKMNKKELLEYLSKFDDNDMIVIPMRNRGGFEKINKVWSYRVTVRDGRLSNGMENKLEFCGDIEGSFKAIVLEN